MASSLGHVRLRDLFAAAAVEKRAVLLPYMTAGLPNPERSPGLFAAMAAAGADGFEVGIPYSDPLMDGPTIHEAGLRALEAGTSLERGLMIAETVAAETALPMIVMSYVNPVLSVGPEAFAARAAAAGASAVIIADLPSDEAAPFQASFEDAGLGLVLFAAPTTDLERLKAIAAAEPPFIYGVSDLGVTGARARSSTKLAALAARVRDVTDAPFVAGVGISTPAQAHEAAAVADGVIVGSALVQIVVESPDPSAAEASLAKAVVGFAAAMKR